MWPRLHRGWSSGLHRSPPAAAPPPQLSPRALTPPCAIRCRLTPTSSAISSSPKAHMFPSDAAKIKYVMALLQERALEWVHASCAHAHQHTAAGGVHCCVSTVCSNSLPGTQRVVHRDAALRTQWVDWLRDRDWQLPAQAASGVFLPSDSL